MTEKPVPNQGEIPAPQRWHDAIRKLPADSNTPELFVSSAFKSTISPLMYRFISVEEDSSFTGLDRGIYIETNLKDSRLLTMDNEIFGKLSYILTTSETPGRIFLDVPGPELDMALDLSNAFYVVVFGFENGGLMLQVKPADATRLTGLDQTGFSGITPDRNN